MQRTVNSMSRTKETWNTIDDLKSAIIGDVKQPTLYLLPLLSEIALSLAVIADKMKDGDHAEGAV